ncbi:hydroxymethylglutaryl-CoA lyase [Fimbriimonadia bacterium ATM]|nr:MAG: hydroxymethylglutaryl-CoA lyase [Armatimonadota bacterium]MBC6970332.1 hydroxymethylglutaryl-CoA lyase [Armatimonadota bacterium]MCE7899737.1 hydroxymethylglutaryl-CoA lyase [Armatimonadetes bacterium ATM1]MDL1929840.1 hydroxymethylglutaryl-CoA lyase [Fimbriimonadia bacterium ATM]RIJ95919.1 MAG: hydroxymethylglutaryl-CoA lyase [Armatimonadota bacterium]
MNVRIVEVGPRDGLQNVQATVPTEVKVAYVNALSKAGLQEIEVSSFVSPRWVPQLADAEQVFTLIDRVPGVRYSALVPNEKGLERAVACRVDKIAVFTAASETFSHKNVNASIEDTIVRLRPVVASSPVPVRGYVSTAFYCPYEGKIEPDRVLAVCDRLVEIGCSEISIGDTIGRAVPEDVDRLLERLLSRFAASIVAMHFHDTFGNAILNVRRSFEAGIRIFDGSTGGVGGCPFAPGAKGNVATEALVAEFGSDSGVNLDRIEQAAAVITPYV